MTETTPTVDLRMLVAIHSAHRRETGLAAGVVRAVPEGDRRRAAVVADHVTLCLTLLEHHLALADELLWPRLRERGPDGADALAAAAVRRAGEVLERLEQARALVPRWRHDAREAHAAPLAHALDDLAAAVSAQVDADADLVPLLARCLTEREWAAFVERGAEPVPASMMSVVLGMLLHEADPDAVAGAFPAVPAPLRRLLAAGAHRSFRRYSTTIHGAPVPGRR
jgi:hypothetical protein